MFLALDLLDLLLFNLSFYASTSLRFLGLNICIWHWCLWLQRYTWETNISLFLGCHVTLFLLLWNYFHLCRLFCLWLDLFGCYNIKFWFLFDLWRKIDLIFVLLFLFSMPLDCLGKWLISEEIESIYTCLVACGATCIFNSYCRSLLGSCFRRRYLLLCLIWRSAAFSLCQRVSNLLHYCLLL